MTGAEEGLAVISKMEGLPQAVRHSQFIQNQMNNIFMENSSKHICNVENLILRVRDGSHWETGDTILPWFFTHNTDGQVTFMYIEHLKTRVDPKCCTIMAEGVTVQVIIRVIKHKSQD